MFGAVAGDGPFGDSHYLSRRSRTAIVVRPAAVFVLLLACTPRRMSMNHKPPGSYHCRT